MADENAVEHEPWKQRERVTDFIDTRPFFPWLDDMYSFAFGYLKHFGPGAQRIGHILDLGCGDGYTGLAFYKQFAHAKLTLVDFAPAMLEQARQRVGDDRNVRIVEADMATDSVAELLDSPVDFVVTSFAIHHLRYERQAAVYQQVFDALSPGGAFINLEHIASCSEKHEAMYRDLFYEQTARNMREAGRDVKRADIEAADSQEIDRLSSPDQLCQWMFDAGFAEVACIYQAGFLGAFGGVKPYS